MDLYKLDWYMVETLCDDLGHKKRVDPLVLGIN